MYSEPFLGVGGIGSPFVTVRSGPLPPFGPIIWYCPLLGAGCPGLNDLLIRYLCLSEWKYLFLNALGTEATIN
jgi:hypothetical protein